MNLQSDWVQIGLDIAIVATVIYAATLVYEFRNRLHLKYRAIGCASIFAALTILGTCQAFDLTTLHLFPLFGVAPELKNLTWETWSGFHEYTSLFAVGLIAIGLLVIARNIRMVLGATEGQERMFRLFLDNIPIHTSLKDHTGRFLLTNSSLERWLGLSVKEFIGKTMHDLLDDPAFLESLSESERIVLENNKIHETRVRVKGPDDKVRDFAVTKFPVQSPDRSFTHIGSIAVDITERLQAEANAAESEMRLLSLLEASPARITLKDVEGKFIMVNRTFADNVDATAEAMVGKSMYDCSSKDYADKSAAQDRDILETGNVLEMEYETKSPEGLELHRHLIKFPVRGVTDAVEGIGSISTDITARKRTEAALRESEARLHDAIEAMSEGFALYDRDERLVLCNELYRQSFPTLARIEGLIVPGMRFEDFVRAGAERGLVFTARGRVEEHMRERLEKFRDSKGPTEFQQPRGNWIRFEEKKIASGGTVCIRSDITKFKLAEEQLHQAQKMEIVGQLTGGMAHDFNNLLGVIIGNLDLLAEELGDNSDSSALVEAATKAALNGAHLNRQLLAFSRKQMLLPKVIDVNENVLNMSRMLRRTLGETIEIRTRQSHGPWTAEVDEAQLESALLNLAINARDAMPAGGTLTIETKKVSLNKEYVSTRSEVAPGEYVNLTVRDNGTGMPPEILAKVFEPFFTTKDVGKGAGLGLSMVFGFVKQSGGHVEAESAIEQGTSVELYLPYAKAR